MLALNRCLNFFSPRVTEILFGSTDNRLKTGWRAWLWVLPPLGCGVFYFFFGPAHFYWSPLLQSGATNPHFGYATEMTMLVITIKI
jgi:hypothetical protein